MFPLMMDAAHPPTHMPDGYAVAAGYLGGNTPADHVWTPEEWAVFKGIKKLPIFIPQIAIHPVAGNETGGQDATRVAEELHNLSVPFTNAVALDMETVVAPVFKLPIFIPQIAIHPVAVMRRAARTLRG